MNKIDVLKLLPRFSDPFPIERNRFLGFAGIYFVLWGCAWYCASILDIFGINIFGSASLWFLPAGIRFCAILLLGWPGLVLEMISNLIFSLFNLAVSDRPIPPFLSVAMFWALFDWYALPTAYAVVILPLRRWIREPGLPSAKLRVADSLQEIDVGQLAFTDPECIAFLRQVHGIHVTDGAATRLDAAVDGWIAALQLAALSGRRLSSAANSNAMLAARRTDIFGFLASEVRDALDRPMRDFLPDTSILERLSARLCNAVRMSDDSAALLIRAERAGLLLSRLDDRRHWY